MTGDITHSRAPNPEWKDKDPVLGQYYWRKRAQLAERILRHALDGREIGRAHHIADLETKVEHLQQIVTHAREAAERQNRKLRATNLIVGCDGGCTIKSFEYPEVVTEEFVSDVERIATRLRAWFGNHEHRLKEGWTQPGD